MLDEVVNGYTTGEDRASSRFDQLVGDLHADQAVGEIHGVKRVVDEQIGAHRLVNDHLLNEGEG